jgi:glycosyltransferase involved in cell wall biosynthesis
MPRILHIVTSPGFAGVERYVCNAANASTERGWEVAVVGGDAARMLPALLESVSWEPGSTLSQAARSVRRLGRFDVCHAHMTAAELVAVTMRASHRAPIVSTRHFAARRGASLPGRLVAPWIAHSLACEIAIGDFVAAKMERPPSSVLHTGVPESACLWRPSSREVLVLQRLESDKDTLTALRAWREADLVKEGWSLRIYGDGAQRASLESFAASERLEGVSFGGWTSDVAGALARAGMFLATAPAEPLGLAVLDAMAAGVPVVAAAAGGHLETAGQITDAPLFTPGDPRSAAAALRSLLDEAERARLSRAGRELVHERFTLDRFIDGLLAEYDAVLELPLRVHERPLAGPVA